MGRRRFAQALLATMLLALVLLPWATASGAQGISAPSAIARGEGQLAMLAAVVGIVLVQFNVRPAWMAAGLAVAVLVRESLVLRSGGTFEPGAGLLVGAALSIAATLILWWNLVTDIEQLRQPDDT